jgi:CheY-like chemotaxis protein
MNEVKEFIHVLLVEDNAGDVRLFRDVVDDCGLPVLLRVARDGQEALEMLGVPSLKPDLIILDLNMPRVSGLAFLQRFRNNDVPVVIFSSSSNVDEIRKALELGAREFACKPTDLDSFCAVVQGMLAKWAPPLPTACQKPLLP